MGEKGMTHPEVEQAIAFYKHGYTCTQSIHSNAEDVCSYTYKRLHKLNQLCPNLERDAAQILVEIL
jgi:hypothetical protein